MLSQVLGESRRCATE